MITVPVRQITRATPRIRILNLDLRAADFSFAAGQAVMLGLSGSPLRKPYSIASAPWEVAEVRHHAGARPGRGQRRPRSASRAGVARNAARSRGPFGSFGLPERVERPLLFVAGGTGIAPLRSMLIEHLSRPTRHPVGADLQRALGR